MSAILGPNVFDTATEPLVELMSANAQERLKQQVELARSSDARSQGLLTVASGFAGVALTGALTAWMADSPLQSLAVGACVAGMFWVGAAAAAMVAMLPVEMHAPGWPPGWIADDIRQGKSDREIASEIVLQLDVMIAENRAKLRRNARWTLASMILLTVAPVVGSYAALVGAVNA